jgi:hypothetical protein
MTRDVGGGAALCSPRSNASSLMNGLLERSWSGAAQRQLLRLLTDLFEVGRDA